MRTAFSDTLITLAKKDKRVILLTGDHGYALFDSFRRECPDQFLNAGVAEQNMIGVAAGLARSGFRPIVYGLSAFIPMRVIEQIKLDIARDKLPVILIGDGAGIVYSYLGCSHQSTEDIACTRALPYLNIYSPADACELTHCLLSAFETSAPSYLRIGKSDIGRIHHAALPRESQGIINIQPRDRGNIAFVATGSMVRTAQELASTEFMGSSVWSVPCLKPIDEDGVLSLCKEHLLIVTLEEHSTLGGLGSAIAEISAEHHPVRVLKIGAEDKFLFECGTYEYLLKEHALDFNSIKRRLLDYLNTHQIKVQHA